MTRRLLYILLISGISQSLKAQSSIPDSTNAIAIITYYNALGNQSPIYNGSEYIPYNVPLQKGHVFSTKTLS